MTSITFKEQIADVLNKALGEEVERIKKEICDDAERKFREAVKERVGNVAINLLEYYSMEMNGPHLVITVKHQ